MPAIALPDGLQSSESLRHDNHKTYDAAVRDATTVKSEASGHAEEKSSIDWTKAYEVFLLCVVKRGGIGIRKDPSDARHQLEAIITIAKHLDAIPAVENAYMRYMMNIDHHRLYCAISEEPESWLGIGLEMKDQNVFKEAYRHVVGRYVTHRQSLTRLPDHVVQSLEKHATRLRCLRWKVNNDLLMLFPIRDRRYFPQREIPESITGNIWQAWVREHLYLLEQDDLGTSEIEPDGGHRGAICKHDSQSPCRSLVGFYQIISKGGDAYLPAEETVHRANVEQESEGTVRRCLAELKRKASELVQVIATSKLLLAGKDNVPYLTCIEPEPEDIPFATGDDDDDVVMED
jgi:hypothetical protein